ALIMSKHPELTKESKSTPTEKLQRDNNLNTWERLFTHHTLNSKQRCVTVSYSKPPPDKLDFVLNSTYRHEECTFPDIMDIYLQPDTVGQQTCSLTYTAKEPLMDVPASSRTHTFLYGGIMEHKNIYNVKLGIPAPHVAQTNAGYSRREDGAFYKV
ncbi:hypothetical protein L9F63_022257, partial [Diploptera punctata]